LTKLWRVKLGGPVIMPHRNISNKDPAKGGADPVWQLASCSHWYYGEGCGRSHTQVFVSHI